MRICSKTAEYLNSSARTASKSFLGGDSLVHLSMRVGVAAAQTT